MQDHTEQTHQVFVPDLPEMEGIRVKGVPSHPWVMGQGWAISRYGALTSWQPFRQGRPGRLRRT